MINEVVLSWSLLVTYSGHSQNVMYFETLELCKRAHREINETTNSSIYSTGSSTYSRTGCIQIRDITKQGEKRK